MPPNRRALPAPCLWGGLKEILERGKETPGARRAVASPASRCFSELDRRPFFGSVLIEQLRQRSPSSPSAARSLKSSLRVIASVRFGDQQEQSSRRTCFLAAALSSSTICSDQRPPAAIRESRLVRPAGFARRRARGDADAKQGRAGLPVMVAARPESVGAGHQKPAGAISTPSSLSQSAPAPSRGRF